MGGPMNTDTAVLAQQAANFDGIADHLNLVMGKVEGTGAELMAVWRGAASNAARTALEHFHVAADKQRLALTEIAESIGLSGTSYQATDDDQAAALAQTMMNHG